MVRYLYTIAGKKFLLEMPERIRISEESAAFLSETEENEGDDRITFETVPSLPGVPEKFHRVDKKQFTEIDGYPAVFVRNVNNGDPEFLITFERDRIRVRRSASRELKFAASLNLLNFLGLEQMLLRKNVLLLHASFIRYRRVGILFSAPSGTGKSTQANLWERYRGSETINGDRAGLVCEDGIWQAYGLPYAGSSGVYRNESAPVAAIIALAQGKRNEIRRLTPGEALRALMPEFSLHHWDAGYMNHALDLIFSLLTEVPVYHLSCLPDEDAVALLADTLKFSETDQ